MTNREEFEKWVADGGISEDEDIESVWIAWAAWQAAKRWIPVSERLPGDGQLVIIRDEYNILDIAVLSFSVWRDKHNIEIFPTHWQPLPPPPEEE